MSISSAKTKTSTWRRWAHSALLSSDTMSDLIGSSQLTGTAKSVLGFHYPGDGGGGDFYYDASVNKNTHNGITVIDPDNAADLATWGTSDQATWFTAGSGTGCWIREYNLFIALELRWSGAKGDDSADDTAPILNSMGLAKTRTSALHCSAGTYRFDQTLAGSPALGLYLSLTSSESIKFTGDGVGVTIFKNMSDTAAGLHIAGGNGVIIDGFTIDNNESTGPAFDSPGQYAKVSNMHIENQGGTSTYAMNIDGSTNASFTNINFKSCTNGIHIGENNPTNYVTLTAISIEVTSGQMLRCNTGSNIRFFGLYMEPHNSSGNIKRFIELVGCVNVDFYTISAEPSGPRILTDAEYIQIGATNDNINFWGGRINHQSATASKVFIRCLGSNIRGVSVEGMFVKSNVTGMTVFENAATGLIGCSLRNITTNFSNAVTGVLETSTSTNVSVENWYDLNTAASHTFKSISLFAKNIGGAIALTLAEDQTLINCRGALTGTGVRDCANINSYEGYTGRNTQTLTGAGAVSLLQPITKLVHSGSGSDALTLADGNAAVNGLKKTIVMTNIGGGTDAVLTPTNLMNGTTVTFNSNGDSAHFEFIDAAWVFLGGTATLA